MTTQHQSHEEKIVVNSERWEYVDKVFPEGTRSKYIVRALDVSPFTFLKSGHRYLFKRSIERYPWQYWGEVFAYRLGLLIGVGVPPTFVAHDNESPGALSEWFYDDDTQETRYEHIDGGDLLLRRDPAYDRAKGKQPGHAHAFEDVCAVLDDFDVVNWPTDLVKIMGFDALIANPDRHHGNWGIVRKGTVVTSPASGSGGTEVIYSPYKLVPAYDNGTSLGHGELEAKLEQRLQSTWLQKHTLGRNARHHMRLTRNDDKGAPYFGLLRHFLSLHPDLKSELRKMCSFDLRAVEGILDELQVFRIEAPLTAARAKLILAIIRTSRDHLRGLVG